MSPDNFLEQNHNNRTHHIAKLPDELIASHPTISTVLTTYTQSSKHVACSTDVAPKQKPNSLLHSLKYMGQHLLSPHPYLLLTGTARQVEDWATESEANRQRLWDVIKDGAVAGLTNLAVEESRLSLTDVRALHQSRYDITNPIPKTLDLEYGAGERERNGSFLKTCQEVERTLYSYFIYCKLFYLNIRTMIIGIPAASDIGERPDPHMKVYYANNLNGTAVQ